MECIILNLIRYLSIINKDQLTESDNEILDALNEKLDNVPKSTISSLASDLLTSPSSLHRLVKKIGFDGFIDFKYAIENYLEEDKEKNNFKLDNGYYTRTLDDVQITYKLNEIKFNEIATDFVSHNDIYCFGTGWKQRQLTDNFANDLLYYGHSIKSLRNIDDLRNASYRMNSNSLVLIVSLSGDLRSYEDIMEYFKNNKITTIGVSRYTDNPLSRIATHSLQFVDSALDIDNHHWSALTLNILLDLLLHHISINSNIVKGN